jgi:hypothetical protein
MLVALLALFVALGGPAQARRLIDGGEIKKGTIRSRQIKDRSIAVRDISNVAVRRLQQTPGDSIASGMLQNGAVTAAKLGNASVTAATLADGAVTGTKVADGSLSTADVARFAGRFRITQGNLGTILPHACWQGEPQGLAPEVAGADISADALLVTPLGAGYDDRLMLTARSSGFMQPSRFVLSLCNPTGDAVTPAQNGLAFSYVIFDVP